MNNEQNISITEQVIKNSFWSFLLSIATKIGGLIFIILLARFLLPESFGLYSLTLTISIIFMSLGNLGINQTFIVFLSKTTKDKKLANAYFNYLLKIKLSVILLISFILFLASNIIADYFNIPSLGVLLKFSAIYILFFSLSSFFASFFYIYKKVKIDFIKEILFQFIRLILVILVFVFFLEQNYLEGIFFSLVLSSFAMLFFSIYQSKKLVPFIFSKSIKKFNKKNIIQFLSYLILSGILIIIFSEIDILMLGKLSGDLKSIGFYNAAMALVFGVAGLTSITHILLPIFSSFKRKRIEKVSSKVIKYTFLINIPAALGMFVFGRYFLMAVYGPSYLEGAIILSVLSFLILSESTSNLFSIFLFSREKPKFVTHSLLISTITNIILNYLLITLLLKISFLWAAVGAAIATILTRFMFAISLIIYSKKKINIKLNFLDIFKPTIASLIMAAVLYFFIQRIDVTLLTGLVLIFTGILVYASIILILGGVNKEDMELIKLVKFKKN